MYAHLYEPPCQSRGDWSNNLQCTYSTAILVLLEVDILSCVAGLLGDKELEPECKAATLTTKSH